MNSHSTQQPVIRYCRAMRVLMFAHLASLVGNPTSKRFEMATAYTGERLWLIQKMKTKISNRNRQLITILIPIIGFVVTGFALIMDKILYLDSEKHIPIWLISVFSFGLLYAIFLFVLADVEMDNDYLYFRYVFKTRKIDLKSIDQVVKGLPIFWNTLSQTKSNWIIIKYTNQQGENKRIYFQSESVAISENKPRYNMLEELIKRTRKK